MMSPTRIILALALVLLALWGAAHVSADSVTDRLRPEIERVIQTLEDPAFKSDGRSTERRQAVRDITGEIFDWAEMARRTLGRHWDARSEAERAEFASVFRELVERALVSRIEQYNGEKIVFAGETVEGDLATVRTRVQSRSGETAVDFRLGARGDRWLIYDVVVDGVSLTANYRAQFEGFLMRFSYPDLVRRMRDRVS
jgi:phospholipid transport system substrate-binding protein